MQRTVSPSAGTKQQTKREKAVQPAAESSAAPYAASWLAPRGESRSARVVYMHARTPPALRPLVCRYDNGMHGRSLWGSIAIGGDQTHARCGRPLDAPARAHMTAAGTGELAKGEQQQQAEGNGHLGDPAFAACLLRSHGDLVRSHGAGADRREGGRHTKEAHATRPRAIPP